MAASDVPVGQVVFDYRSAPLLVDASERTLRKEYALGRLKGFKVGNRVKFHREDLEAWLDLLREEEAQRRAGDEPEPEREAPRPRRRRRQRMEA